MQPSYYVEVFVEAHLYVLKTLCTLKCVSALPFLRHPLVKHIKTYQTLANEHVPVGVKVKDGTVGTEENSSMSKVTLFQQTFLSL